MSSLSIFQTAWAIVLRCYLGSPSVCFASNSSEIAEDADSAIVGICQVEFAGASSMLNVVKGMNTKYFPSPDRTLQTQSTLYERSDAPNIMPINTSLAYREDSGSMEHRPAVLDLAPRGLNNVWNAMFFRIFLSVKCHD